MMMLVLIYISVQFRARTRHGILMVGILLIIATVYQRYHYVIDLVAGAALMVVCVLTSSRLYAFTKSRFQTLESRFTPAAE
jgi:membrane-associated phospholipid phosphatase